MKLICLLSHRKGWLGLVAIMAMVALTGCAAVGPDYVKPVSSVPEAWHTRSVAGISAESSDPAVMATWWKTLNDPILSSLIERAVAGNLDLRGARARVREARALRGVATAGLFPVLSASGSASFSRTSGNGSSASTSARMASSGGTTTSELYNAGLDASWELDIFGGTRRSVEAAERDLEAGEEDERDVLVSLLAEVATNYVEVRTFQARLAVAEANLAIQQETYQLAVWRNQAGLGDELALYQARYNMESTRAQIPPLRTEMEGSMNRIAVLLGEQPGKAQAELKKEAPIPSPGLKVAVGIPADTLRRRPDVRRTERRLAAQTARVGVATAELYPKLTLTGSIGLEAAAFDSLLSSPVRSISNGPRISWPIFQAGALRRKIEVQSAKQEQSLIQYEAAILGAFEEVENGLTAYGEEQHRREALSSGEGAARKAADAARHRYQAGLTDFVNVLEAERSLLTFQDQLAQSEGTVVINLVRLYKALGGGW